MQRLAVDTNLRIFEIGKLFPSSSAMVSLREDHALKPFAFDFIRMVAPRWTADAIATANRR